MTSRDQRQEERILCPEEITSTKVGTRVKEGMRKLKGEKSS